MNRLFDNPKAFAPFYSETVAVRGDRAGRTVMQTVRACVIEDGFDEPVSDGSVSSSRRSFTVMLRRADWRDETKPQLGDRIEYGRLELSVTSVDEMQSSEWMLKARSVK